MAEDSKVAIRHDLSALVGEVISAAYHEGDELSIVLTYRDGRRLRIDLFGKYEPEQMAVVEDLVYG